MLAPNGCWIRKWRASSRRRHWLPACDPTLPKPSVRKSSPATRCAQAWPPRPRSRSAKCRSNSVTHPPRWPQVPAPARPLPGQPYQGIRALTRPLLCHRAAAKKTRGFSDWHSADRGGLKRRLPTPRYSIACRRPGPGVVGADPISRSSLWSAIIRLHRDGLCPGDPGGSKRSMAQCRRSNQTESAEACHHHGRR